MEFIKRTTAPARDNKYYNKPKAYSDPSLDMWVLGGNCTDYAWCRYRECQEDMNGSKKLPTSAASRFWDDAVKKKTLKTGNVAKLGAIACFKGHLAFVEDIIGENIRYSASGYTKLKSTRYIFKMKTIKKGGSWNGKKLLGYIYNPIDFEDDKFTEGKYLILYKKYLRTSPSVDNNKYKYKKLTNTGKKNCDNIGGYARTKQNIIMKLDTFAIDNKGNTWGRTTSGKDYVWICVKDKNGNQVEKV